MTKALNITKGSIIETNIETTIKTKNNLLEKYFNSKNKHNHNNNNLKIILKLRNKVIYKILKIILINYLIRKTT